MIPLTATPSVAPSLPTQPADTPARPRPQRRPEAPAPAPAPAPVSVTDALLRDRHAFLASLGRGEAPADTARALILTVLVAGAILGATLGLYRGGVQVLYAAIKLPLTVLLTAAICAPALTALRRTVQPTADLRGDLLLVLAALALGTLIAAALAPVVLLGQSVRVGYHDLILLTTLCCAVGGLAGLVLLWRGLARAIPTGHRLVGAVLIGVFCLVGGQMSWTLRPWLVRPRTVHVPFVRAVEGGFLEALVRTQRSAGGNFSREAAPTIRSAPDARIRRGSRSMEDGR